MKNRLPKGESPSQRRQAHHIGGEGKLTRKLPRDVIDVVADMARAAYHANHPGLDPATHILQATILDFPTRSLAIAMIHVDAEDTGRTPFVFIPRLRSEVLGAFQGGSPKDYDDARPLIDVLRAPDPARPLTVLIVSSETCDWCEVSLS
jgi:hypothetical protein